MSSKNKGGSSKPANKPAPKPSRKGGSTQSGSKRLNEDTGTKTTGSGGPRKKS